MDALGVAPPPRRQQGMLRPAMLPAVVGLLLVWALLTSDTANTLGTDVVPQPKEATGHGVAASPVARIELKPADDGVEGAGATPDGDEEEQLGDATDEPEEASPLLPPSASPSPAAMSASGTRSPAASPSRSPVPPSPSASAAPPSPSSSPSRPPPAAVPADVGPLVPVPSVEADPAALRDREAREDAAEWARISGLPPVNLPEHVSFPALRRMVSDSLCGAAPTPLPAGEQATCTSGLPLSASMRAYLAEYARRHAAARVRWAAQVNAIRSSGGGGSPVRFNDGYARDVRWLVYERCCGGLGDQLKGYANAALAALLAPEAPSRSFLMEWRSKIPMAEFWTPCPIPAGPPQALADGTTWTAPSEGIDWRVPPGLPANGDPDPDSAVWIREMGLPTRGVAWQDGELAAAMDIANAAGAHDPIVLGWGK
jgi:hypothetical protein